MPRLVKIVATEYKTDFDGCSEMIVRAGLTGWERVSDDDYKFLKENLHSLMSPDHPFYGLDLMLLVADDTPVEDTIVHVMHVLRERQEAEKKRLETIAESNEKKQRRRALDRAMKDKEKVALIENELKKKFGIKE